MKWKGRRESKNVRDITRRRMKPRVSSDIPMARLDKDLAKTRDYDTETISAYENQSPKVTTRKAMSLKNLKDSYKPQHLIPPSKKRK